MDDLDWRLRGACRAEGVDPSTFFDPDYDETDELEAHRMGRLREERRLRAKLICSSCPVWRDCLQAGLYEEHGIWGGLTPEQRRYLRRGQNLGGNVAGPRDAKVKASFVAEADDITRDFLQGYSVAHLAAWYEVPIEDVVLAVRAASSF